VRDVLNSSSLVRRSAIPRNIYEPVHLLSADLLLHHLVLLLSVTVFRMKFVSNLGYVTFRKLGGSGKDGKNTGNDHNHAVHPEQL
jgi:hypothetical protein